MLMLDRCALFAGLVAVLLLSGCTQDIGQGSGMADSLTEECVNLCQGQADAGEDLSGGPCLSNNVGEDAQGNIWVCDVAHDPRQGVDNQPENQCDAYRSGVAKHFVEVDEQCNMLRTI